MRLIMNLVMFDIDGTLTQTYELDSDLYVQALYEVFGFTHVETDWSLYKHATDAGILDELCEHRLRRLPTPEEVLIFRSRFTDLLASAFAADRGEGGAMPGVVEFIGLLAERGYAVAIATGSWMKPARLKLQQAGLHVDHLPAAFADEAHARDRIMKLAEKHAVFHYGQTGFRRTVYFGDGVWDVRASKKLKYRFVGIGRGTRAEKLREAGAKYVFGDFTNREAVLEAVEELCK